MPEKFPHPFYQFWCRGTADYFGLNHYTTYLVEPENTTETQPWEDDSGLIFSQDPKWPSSGSDWLKVSTLINISKMKDVYKHPDCPSNFCNFT